MAKSLILKYKDPNQEIFYVPIVSHFAWKEHWHPAIIKHKLDYLWLASGGYLDLLISDEELLKIQDELGIIRSEFEANPNLSDDETKLYIDRIEATKLAIVKVINERSDILKVSIG